MTAAAAKRMIRRGFGLLAPVVWSLRSKPSLVILAYHRVLPKGHPDLHFEQPGMYVLPETLGMHLRALRMHFEIVDLGDWIRRSKDGDSLPNRACAITFDDGWKDNFDYGLPVLVREQVPATVFLVSDLIGGNYEFWPNRLARLLVAHRARGAALPSPLASFLLKAGVSLDGHTNQTSDIDAAIVACKSQADATMIALLDEVEPRAVRDVKPRSLLNLAEIEAMRDSGFVRYGSHSRRHTRLVPGLAPHQLRDEVYGSRHRLQQVIRGDVELFCYPNGDYSSEALAAVRSAYEAAVITRAGWNQRETDVHMLKRVSIHEDVARDVPSLMARVACLV